MIKKIIFDFDGVIHNTFDLDFSINKELCPGLTEEEFRDFFDLNFLLEKTHSEENQLIFREKEHEAFKLLKIEEKIKEELISLKKEFYLSIVTSNTLRNLKIYIGNNSLDGLFEEVLGEESHKSKEKKFNMIFEKFNLTKENCVFITDTAGDIKEAKKVGLKIIAVDFGFHERKRLEKENPDIIISDISEIRSAINKLRSDNLFKKEEK